MSGHELYRHLRLAGPSAQPLTLSIFATEPGPRALQVRPLPAGLRAQSYALASLPIRVEGWLPFRARVAAPAPGLFLETPRQLVAGYRARVNGRQAVVTVLRSGGPLAVPLGAGENLVELDYQAPRALRLAGWLSTLTWILGLAALARRAPAAGRPRWP